MARYSSVTKHMGRSNRRDHLTLAMMYANTEKEERMPKLLKKLLKSAEESSVRYEREFQRLINKRKDKLLLLQNSIDDKLKEGEMLQCLKQINEIVKSGSPTQESLARSQKLTLFYMSLN
ncbi:hypothetical protein OUZ56_012431 [Daphnia magna]|uniref:Uncharacterized protein n=1 Tax=Daphnia magna TaxID=35525 RepID=A0ABQ9Z343_9CRUS|nr:hypothetical protein OUZ56_012431 [Daphnia magna]